MRQNGTDGELSGRFAVCGFCNEAYGFCFPALDGTPIACRCPRVSERLLSCSEAACGAFVVRRGPLLEVTPFGPSENRCANRVARKVVPLFRPGEKDPWKVVDSADVPPGGISWDGTPLK